MIASTNHVCEYRLKHNRHEEPYFQMFAVIQLREEKSLLTYETHFHAQGFDTMN